MTKRCYQCQKDLPVSEYHKDHKSKDGLCATCRSCKKAKMLSIPRKCLVCGKEFFARKDQVALGNGLCCSYKCSMKRRLNSQGNYTTDQKASIRVMVDKFIARNNIQRPSICPNCNNLGQVEAHHDDYGKPFVIRWLCSSCHRGLHFGDKVNSPEVTLA